MNTGRFAVEKTVLPPGHESDLAESTPSPNGSCYTTASEHTNEDLDDHLKARVTLAGGVVSPNGQVNGQPQIYSPPPVVSPMVPQGQIQQPAPILAGRPPPQNFVQQPQVMEQNQMVSLKAHVCSFLSFAHFFLK